MSDEEEKDVDIESDEEDDEDDFYDGDGDSGGATQFLTQAEKRAHHNALERKRRDHIKDSFHGLRDAVPTLQGEKVSRAQVLKQASEYIQFMSKKNGAIQQDIEDMKRQNNALEHQIRMLERGRATGSALAKSGVSGGKVRASGAGVGTASELADHNYGEVSDNSEGETSADQKRKKLKTSK